MTGAKSHQRSGNGIAGREAKPIAGGDFKRFAAENSGVSISSMAAIIIARHLDTYQHAAGIDAARRDGESSWRHHH